jgi:hypothetical protein
VGQQHKRLQPMKCKETARATAGRQRAPNVPTRPLNISWIICTFIQSIVSKTYSIGKVIDLTGDECRPGQSHVLSIRNQEPMCTSIAQGTNENFVNQNVQTASTFSSSFATLQYKPHSVKPQTSNALGPMFGSSLISVPIRKVRARVTTSPRKTGRSTYTAALHTELHMFSIQRGVAPRSAYLSVPVAVVSSVPPVTVRPTLTPFFTAILSEFCGQRPVRDYGFHFILSHLRRNYVLPPEAFLKYGCSSTLTSFSYFGNQALPSQSLSYILSSHCLKSYSYLFSSLHLFQLCLPEIGSIFPKRRTQQIFQ